TACGGGGSGSDSAGGGAGTGAGGTSGNSGSGSGPVQATALGNNPSVVYSGATSPATLTQAATSAGRMADSVLQAAAFNFSLGAYGITTPDTFNCRGGGTNTFVAGALASDGTGV